MSEEDEDSLSFYLKNKENKEDNKEEINESEIEKDKKEEEEIFNRYEKIGNLTDIKSIKESDLTKNYDEQGNKYYNEYKVLQELGCGAYSKVKLVMKDNIKYAMKIIDKKELKKKKIFKQDKDGNVIVTNLLKDALKEIAILKKLDHPNIIKLYEILHNYQKEKIYLIMEYAEYGDIVEYDEDSGIFSINKHVSDSYNKNKDTDKNKKSFIGKKYYSEKDIMSFCKHIVLGLDYLHKNGIIHHDIKPNNILLCKKGICKITDFNFSSILDNLNVDNIGQNSDSADNFKAPETLVDKNENGDENTEEKEKLDKKTDKDNDEKKIYRGKPLDIWALGVTLYIIAYLKFPFDTDKGILELYNLIKKEKVKFPNVPCYSKKLKYLIEKCLEKDPTKRKTADEILKMCAIHKYEVVDKYKPIFKKRNVDIEISIEELCMTLDFFHNGCNAVFENPKDKTKPMIFKFKKNLIKYEIPKGRSLTRITNKQNITNIPIERPIMNPPPIKYTKQTTQNIKIVTVKEDTEISNPIGVRIIRKKIIDKDNNNSIIEKEIIEIKDQNGNDVSKEEVQKLMNNLEIIGAKNEDIKEEGKLALQKYIEEK